MQNCHGGRTEGLSPGFISWLIEGSKPQLPNWGETRGLEGHWRVGGVSRAVWKGRSVAKVIALPALLPSLPLHTMGPLCVCRGLAQLGLSQVIFSGLGSRLPFWSPCITLELLLPPILYPFLKLSEECVVPPLTVSRHFDYPLLLACSRFSQMFVKWVKKLFNGRVLNQLLGR